MYILHFQFLKLKNNNKYLLNFLINSVECWWIQIFANLFASLIFKTLWNYSDCQLLTKCNKTWNQRYLLLGQMTKTAGPPGKTQSIASNQGMYDWCLVNLMKWPNIQMSHWHRKMALNFDSVGCKSKFKNAQIFAHNVCVLTIFF